MCPSTLTLDVLQVFGRSVHFPMACLTFTSERALEGEGGGCSRFSSLGRFSALKATTEWPRAPSTDRVAGFVAGCHGLEPFKFSRHWRPWGLRRAYEPVLLCRRSPIKLDYARNVDSIGLIGRIERERLGALSIVQKSIRLWYYWARSRFHN